MIRALAAACLAGALLGAPAFAQNCESIKSGLGVNARVQNADRDEVGADLDTIEERGWIRFAVYDDFAPWSWRDGETPRGVDVELARLIADELGVEPRFSFFVAGETVDADLREHVWKGPTVSGEVSNVMLHVPYDRELGCRNELVVLTGQYFNESLAIAYRLADYPDGGPVPAYFRFDTVGVENDSISDFYLSGIGGGMLIPKMSRYRSTAAAMDALGRGEVMAVMGPRGEIEAAMGAGQTLHQPPLPGLARDEWTLGVAVRMSWRPLAYAVDDAIRAAVDDGRMQAIFEGYGLTWTPPEW